MAINNFIPEVWSARLLENLNKAHVFASVCNRNYEGEIKAYGDQVKINALGRVTIGSYTKNTDISSAETLTDAQKILYINQAKYFNFQIDDIDKTQQNPKVMDGAMREAAYGLNDVADKYIASLYTESTNTIGTDDNPVATFTAATQAYDNLVKIANAMDEANVPKDDTRYVIVPAWYHSLLLLDSRFISAGTGKTDDVLANGFVGRAAGLNIYVSNNVATTEVGETDEKTTMYHIMGGYSQTMSFAEQITEVEAYRPELRFADAVKGLHLFGAKVVRNETLIVLTTARPTSLI